MITDDDLSVYGCFVADEAAIFLNHGIVNLIDQPEKANTIILSVKNFDIDRHRPPKHLIKFNNCWWAGKVQILFGRNGQLKHFMVDYSLTSRLFLQLQLDLYVSRFA